MENWNSHYNRIVWADVPVQDLRRAGAFYAAVLSNHVTYEQDETGDFALLDHQDGNGGCLVLDGTPSANGPLVYFNVNGRLQAAVEQVVPLGGQVLLPPHSIGPHGYRAIILDSEGNRIALHSLNDD